MRHERERKYIKTAYGLTDEQVFEAEKLSNRSSFSLCAAAKAIKAKTPKLANE